MSNVNPIFGRLFSDMAAVGLMPKRQEDYEAEPAIRTDIPRPADPVAEEESE